MSYWVPNFCYHKLVQVEILKNRCELQELELQQSAKKAQEAMALAADESAKCKAAKEVIKSLAAQVMFGSYVYAYVTYICQFLYPSYCYSLCKESKYNMFS